MSDINELYYQQSQARQQMTSYESRQTDVKQKIQRLEAAKKSVESIKREVSEQKSNAARLSHVERWEGETCRQYKETVRDSLLSGFRTYYNDVDDIRDDINTEITRLENESREIQGILGSVLNWLNDIGTAIDNFFN